MPILREPADRQVVHVAPEVAERQEAARGDKPRFLAYLTPEFDVPAVQEGDVQVLGFNHPVRVVQPPLGVAGTHDPQAAVDVLDQQDEHHGVGDEAAQVQALLVPQVGPQVGVEVLVDDFSAVVGLVGEPVDGLLEFVQTVFQFGSVAVEALDTQFQVPNGPLEELVVVLEPEHRRVTRAALGLGFFEGVVPVFPALFLGFERVVPVFPALDLGFERVVPVFPALGLVGFLFEEVEPTFEVPVLLFPVAPGGLPGAAELGPQLVGFALQVDVFAA